jgi:hypothetical protein
MHTSKDDGTGLFSMANIDMGLSRREKLRERESKKRRGKKKKETTTTTSIG